MTSRRSAGSSYPCSNRSGCSVRCMSIFARLRTVPPMPIRFSPLCNASMSEPSSASRTDFRNRLSCEPVGGSSSRYRSLTRSEPSSNDHVLVRRRSRNREISALPPPTSSVAPLVTERSWTAPTNPNRASVSPSMICSGTPSSRARSSSNRPSSASRTADVATARIRSAPAPSATARKSRRASSVRSMAEGPSSAPACSSRASRSGARASSMTSRCSPSRSRKTIIRAEFEPTSSTANGRSSCSAMTCSTATTRCSHRSVGVRLRPA